jgi:hypothetical protein
MQRSLVAAVLLIVAACGPEPGPWQHANLPEERWKQDEAECRRYAQARAEREFAIDSWGGAPGYGRGTTLFDQMGRFDAEKRRNSLFDACMKSRGYARTPTSAPSAPESTPPPAPPTPVQ